MPKLKPTATVKLNLRMILDDAVMRGVRIGWRKSIDEADGKVACPIIVSAVMAELENVFVFEEPDV